MEIIKLNTDTKNFTTTIQLHINILPRLEIYDKKYIFKN